MLCAALAPGRAAAGEEYPAPASPSDASPPDHFSTFVYREPVPTTRLRLAIEELTMAALAVTGYAIQNPKPSYDSVPPVNVWDKLRFAPGSWYLDGDELATNWVGHPTAGTLYYVFARANRVSILEAAAWTFAASTTWELLEWKEPMSLNDFVVTPLAGLAIGEAFTQLSGWFDRSGADGVSKALALIFDPPRKIHDALDGAVPLRDPKALGWHEFQARAGGGMVWQGGTAYAALDLAVVTELFRARGYREPGSVGFGFADGNVSRIAVSSMLSGDATVDFLFETETALVGYYGRDLELDGDGLSGWDFFVGGTAAYEFGSHVWDVTLPKTKNQIAMIRIPGVDLRLRLHGGVFEIEMGLDAALDFGGVEPLDGPPGDAPPPGRSFPQVYEAQGYYWGLGIHLAPSLQVRMGALSAGVGARLDSLRGLDGPYVPELPDPVADFADERFIASAWLRLRIPAPELDLSLRGNWWSRWSSVQGQAHSARQASLVATCAVIF